MHAFGVCVVCPLARLGQSCSGGLWIESLAARALNFLHFRFRGSTRPAIDFEIALDDGGVEGRSVWIVLSSGIAVLCDCGHSTFLRNQRTQQRAKRRRDVIGFRPPLDTFEHKQVRAISTHHPLSSYDAGHVAIQQQGRGPMLAGAGRPALSLLRLGRGVGVREQLWLEEALLRHDRRNW